MSINYVLISKFCELTGYSEDAVRTKIRDGVWLNGQVYVKAPDNRVLISIEGYNEWVETALVLKKPQHRVTKSPSHIKGRNAANESSYGPAPLTSAK